MRASLIVILLTSIFILIPVSSSQADWIVNGTNLCDADMDQSGPVAIPDGSGGAFLVWRDYRSYFNDDIYAQRIDAHGNAVWTPNGVAVCTEFGDQGEHQLTADGSGGIVVTWTDYRGGPTRDIYAQRLDGDGNALWTANGVTVCNAIRDQFVPQITADETGGAYIVWEDYRTGVDLDIYYQRVLSNGTTLHGSTGAWACTTSYNQSDPVIAPDNAGGAILVWSDARSGTDWDLYGVRFHPTGATQWAPNGKAVCDASGAQLYPRVAPDGLGGVFVVWADDRGTDRNIYSQRLNHDGYELWATNGIPICTATETQEFFDITTDTNENSLIIAWNDLRHFPYGDIYAQKVNLYGDTLWAADGLAVCSAPLDQGNCTIASDGAGGAIVCWEDYRNLSESDVYAQRIDANGTPDWATDGVPVSVYFYHQFEPVIVTDEEHGALVFWHDYRNKSHYDLYGQRVTSDGLWGYPCPVIHSVRDVPGDQGGLVNVTWDASRLDVPPGDIDVYTVWRAIDAMAAAARIKAGAVVIDRPIPAAGTDLKGVLRADNPYYWELVESVQAFQLDRYAKPVVTLFDSTSVTDELHYFQVIAHDNGGSMWISPPASGRSLDNLSPAAPLSLVAARVLLEVELEWSPSEEFEGDFSHYAVYRSMTSGFTPGPSNFLTTAPDTMLTDTSAELFTRYYYIVTAYDVHENQSDPSNEAMVDVATGVEEQVPSYDRLTLFPNTPNPFNSSTEIRFGLPAQSNVVLEVYDIAGRRVYEQRVDKMAAGLRTLTFTGRNGDGVPMPSGVYFYRVTAEGVTQTQKLVITR